MYCKPISEFNKEEFFGKLWKRDWGTDFQDCISHMLLSVLEDNKPERMIFSMRLAYAWSSPESFSKDFWEDRWIIRDKRLEDYVYKAQNGVIEHGVQIGAEVAAVILVQLIEDGFVRYDMCREKLTLLDVIDSRMDQKSKFFMNMIKDHYEAFEPDRIDEAVKRILLYPYQCDILRSEIKKPITIHDYVEHEMLKRTIALIKDHLDELKVSLGIN